MKRSKKKITAAELMARLNADPEWVARRARRDEEREQRHAEEERAEAPLVTALNAIGLDVSSVWDLVNRDKPYPQAIPILLAHFSRSYPPRVREGIGRSLAVPEAKAFCWDDLKRLFREEKEVGPKEGLAVALAGAADDDVLDDVIALARDRQLGPYRAHLLAPLQQSRNPKARAALMALGTDPDLAKEVQVILKRSITRQRRKSVRGGTPA